MIKRIAEYVWQIAANALYVVVVIFVLNRLEGRPEQIVVAVLGLLYVSSRAQALSTSRTFVNLAWGISDHFVRIRELLGDETLDEHKMKIQKPKTEAPHVIAKSVIDGVFLSIISLICLITIWTHL